MADQADQSEAFIEGLVAQGIDAARRPALALKPIGICRWCGDPVAPGRTHCKPVDNACAEDHAKHERNRRRS